ncbi:MAG: HAD-IC family P-type ATPase [Candidatus Methanoplasma sp.]|jgi:cation-transporting ATPase E|nr:HAD-IC family P-type ATPase [Candidatus Methanoplasma sp.]
MEQGLTEAEVRERVLSGKANSFESPVSRSYSDIVFRNVFTVFNLILFVLGAALVYFDEVISAISATGVIALNILIATVQEIRAKRRLDKIALLLRPTVNVIRNGTEKSIDPSGIVMDDIIHISSGDQAQVDGELIESISVEMDESPLTGESKTIRKRAGDTIYSGAVCITGDGYFRVTALGEDTFVSKMLLSAKKYKKKKTPLQIETATVTEMLMVVAIFFLAISFIVTLVGRSGFGGGFAMKAVVILDIVPVALFLLITITYMIAAVRMANGGVLLQNSNSVESMSHVDTVCMDKTGTITTNNLLFENIETFTDIATAERLIRAFVTVTGSKNRTVKALEERFGTSDTELLEEIQFSSERKYSAVRVKTDGSSAVIFVGAWSSLKNSVSTDEDIASKISDLSRKGLRTVLVCAGDDTELYVSDEPRIPPLIPVALVSIRDEVRPDCKRIIEEFLDNGMDLKVISGDDPETVDALFALADIPGERNIISGDDLEKLSGDELRRAVLKTNIFGRMKPEQKEIVINALKESGRYVTMVGDGVNDVRSIKAAQVGVALQSGSGAARGVADMILVKDNFAALPKTIIEGKRTVTGMRDILKLYLTRNFALAILVGVLLITFGRIPLLPVHNAYYALVSVSIAAFLMAIWAKPSENKELILPDVLRYTIPTAVLLSVFALVVYVLFELGTDGFWSSDLGEGFYQSMNSLYYPGLGFGDFMDHMGMDGHGYSGITARNAMLLFLVLAGISQIFLISPLSKLYSVDGKTSRDLKPSILAILLFGLVALLYNVPEVAVKIASLALFPPLYYLIIGVFVAVWFFTTVLLLRTSKLNRLTEVTESAYEKKLKEEIIKNKEDQGR